ncbi:hypothetical protein FEM48_Zijuj12G0120300 [Ziziphus jujuba var. spinosa]|uniref:Protein Jade-1 n=1 Tax=Ziziphus jujuba var. spinosa TaxID=714518 RepID=A0A978UD75_ZIZJJ|nr:protein Jade-1-like [Ziziphus jujuba var. spinosa]KAH7512718.1 hypothetical protein FEM48_Zijuj12G0120300 [Ziziphus jujuba var. spinosa]
MQMGSEFNGFQLPPHKRFRLFQQQQLTERQRFDNYNAASLSTLPAKKRRESRDPSIVADPTATAAASAAATTICLPAKKRVWALPADLSPEKKFSAFDLNMEYKPFSEEDSEAVVVKRKKEEEEHIQATGSTQEGKEAESVCEDDNDGIVCAICQSTDGDPSDPIVLCDGCDLMVHASCYGNPLVKGIPEGDWFCAQCSVSRSSQSKKKMTFSCCLCPTTGGAMKPTSDDSGWAHLVCAVFVPEVFFRDPEGREGIDCSKVPKKRWGEKCYVCKNSNGCAINCSEPKCPLGFHVTCGLKEDLCIEYREGRKKGAVVAGFCKTHSDLWMKQQQTGKFKIVAREDKK